MTSDRNQPQWVVRRKRRHPRPRRRIGAALHAGPALAAGGAEFPGLPEHRSGRANAVSGFLSILLHVGGLGVLFLIAWLAPPELVEQLLPVELVRPDSTPAPAPRAIAEHRAAFAPAPQAVAPQIVNPDVVARAQPVSAQALQLDSVSPVIAPTEVARRVVATEHVQAMRSIAAATTSPIEVAPVAPALRGPVEFQAPVGPSVGPRAVVQGGDTVGLAAPGALGTGSSVREGIASDRDVAGAASGPRLASVNTRVGDSLRGGGPGGTGTGAGTSFEECMSRREVQSYLQKIHQRVLSRWVLPPETPPNQQVKLKFTLDVAGSAGNVEFLTTDNPALGESAATALRSAAPFPPMTDPVRCLSRTPIHATFTNPTG
ncbi:MAG: TonB C-terminal domain-containing protein, partial [Myxococcota bacterium]